MKKVLAILISILFINTFVFAVLLLNRPSKIDSTSIEQPVELLPLMEDESVDIPPITEDENPSIIDEELVELSDTESLETSTVTSNSEDILLQYDYYYNEKIENSFTIKTLQEQYQDTLSDKVYLDESVISYNDLRYLNVLHLGYDGEIHSGELIVNAAIAEEVLKIFRELYDIGYPIEKMKVISHYGGSDTASMEDNNTSGFNFREMTAGEALSKHAYGLAIDLNPVVNPYIKSGVILPSNGSLYVDRNQEELGMIKKNDVVYQIFKRYGWTWGGDWNSPKDYQHFEKSLN